MKKMISSRGAVGALGLNLRPHLHAWRMIAKASASAKKRRVESVGAYSAATTQYSNCASTSADSYSAERDGTEAVTLTSTGKRIIRRSDLKEHALSLGFSAGGLLFPYYVGVLKQLRDDGIVDDRNRIAGASAGSLAAAVFHCGLTSEEVIESTKVFYRDLRVNGTTGRLRSVLQQSMDSILPNDIHYRCRDRAYIAVTQVQPELKSYLISNFYSKKDVIDTLLTSCFIPLWFDGGRVTNTWRKRMCMDGGLTNFIPTPPSPEGKQGKEIATIKISCFDTRRWPLYGNIDICPGKYKQSSSDSSNNFERLKRAFLPGTDDDIDRLVQEGMDDAKQWIDETII